MLPNCADMAARRAVYLAVLLGCGIFYIAYGQWLAWFLLVTVVLLPWFSLVLSLPAMLNFQVRPASQKILETGEDPQLWLLGSCIWPMPPFRGQLVLRSAFTGEVTRYREDMDSITDHCGGYTISLRRVRIFDYLGLFAMPVWKKEERILLVRPKPVAMALPETLYRRKAARWKPKYGGGFAENHELRLYRPGDSLNQVHWKLTAKTGTLILREPVEPVQGLILLTLHLRGTPEELDRKLGRLLWLGRKLLEQDISFELRALAAGGTLSFSIREEAGLLRALDTLLCQGTEAAGDLREQGFAAAWHCHIGGAPDES